MNIKLELISNAITKSIIQNIDADKIADTTAINMLSEIQEARVKVSHQQKIWQGANQSSANLSICF